MEFHTIHHEKIPFRLMYALAVIMGLLAAGMLAMFIYSRTAATLSSDALPGWFFLMEFGITAGLTLLILQFRTYELILTPEGLVIKFGRLRKSISWLNIDSYQGIGKGTLANSGNWKIKPGKHGWSSQYTVIGEPRILLQLNTGKIRTAIFSTARPEEVLRIIRRQTGKTESSSSIKG